MMDDRDLDWKKVAYMGRWWLVHSRSLRCGRCWTSRGPRHMLFEPFWTRGVGRRAFSTSWSGRGTVRRRDAGCRWRTSWTLRCCGSSTVSIWIALRPILRVVPKVILISSSEDLLTKALADNLSQRTGCEVRQLGKDIQGEIIAMMDDRDLDWKKVAYMGRWWLVHSRSLRCGRCWTSRGPRHMLFEPFWTRGVGRRAFSTSWSGRGTVRRRDAGCRWRTSWTLRCCGSSTVSIWIALRPILRVVPKVSVGTLLEPCVKGG
uniref:Uncharacterized protein n=2 Tax=Oncorhynchus tshawytscha TaxID=74940 RepID=A0AAZ3RUI8_ONCTS